MHLGERNIGQLALCGWPGLARLWLRGTWSSLTLAIGFSVLLNAAMVATFVWPTLLGETFPVIAWSAIAVIWICSTLVSYRMVGVWSSPPVMAAEAKVVNNDDFLSEKECDTLFNRAQGEYLKGNWIEAEALLKRQLSNKERDVESRLLLATLFRHTKQLDFAENELDTMLGFDDSVHWQFEIQCERDLIDQMKIGVSNEEQTAIPASVGAQDVPTTSTEPDET